MKNLITALMLTMAIAELLTTTVLAETSLKLIKGGACTAKGSQIEFSDGSKKDFLNSNGKCADFRLSNDRKYAAWKIEGTLMVQVDGGEKETHHDATLYAFNGFNLVEVANNRYIENWYFIPGLSEIFSEAEYEHGPSVYDLYDLKKSKSIESCDGSEILRCPRLQKLISQKK
jgi:hypothetical protein